MNFAEGGDVAEGFMAEQQFSTPNGYICIFDPKMDVIGYKTGPF